MASKFGTPLFFTRSTSGKGEIYRLEAIQCFNIDRFNLLFRAHRMVYACGIY